MDTISIVTSSDLNIPTNANRSLHMAPVAESPIINGKSSLSKEVNSDGFVFVAMILTYSLGVVSAILSLFNIQLF